MKIIPPASIDNPQTGERDQTLITNGGQQGKLFNRVYGDIEKRWLSEQDYVTVSVLEGEQPYVVTYCRIEADDRVTTIVRHKYKTAMSAIAVFTHYTLRRPEKWKAPRTARRSSKMPVKRQTASTVGQLVAELCATSSAPWQRSAGPAMVMAT